MDEHNLKLRDAHGHVLAGMTVEPGQTQTLTVNLPAGSYTLYCSLYNHEQLGMKSTLTVR
jgi:uncharacterized cupredoxin-like copper-binding protein